MQTQQEIRALLASAGLAPNRYLGQHFLVDLNLMRLLLGAAQVRDQDVVLEIGCGTGSLTEALAEQAGQVIAVDVDTSLMPIAETQLDAYHNVTLLNRDILANKHQLDAQVLKAIADARRLSKGRLLLVANLPYHVASPAIINLVTGSVVVDAMAVTVQKEVGHRMMAVAGSSHYGTLSVLLQATGRLRRLRVLRPSVFWPPPQVDSIMLTYVREPSRVNAITDMKLLREVIDLFFGHRRKMLKTATKSAVGRLARVQDWDRLFAACQVDAAARPEQVTPESFVALANTLKALD